MRFGFIGAGKVGFSLGKYFADSGLKLSGYYSEIESDAIEASKFTESKCYTDIEQLLEDSDVIFLTVPDSVIGQVWNQIKSCHFSNKIMCHCSGALSSEIFSDISERNSFGFSIHPLFAVSDKYNSYKELPTSFFTIEGPGKGLETIKEIFDRLGNKYCVIDKEDKVKYHVAAAIVSNLVVGIIDMGQNMLKECGFDDESATQAFSPIIRGNINHILSDGTVNSLTGPIERNDVSTVKKHLSVLEGNQKRAYIENSKLVLDVAKRKNIDRDYSEMEELLK